MSEQQINPHKVTKPIQLLAAWLVGLVLIDTLFLLAAVKLPADSWQNGTLVVAAVFNVPVFLISLFILQTKFRAELQEDAYYSEYLNKKTSQPVRVDVDTLQDAKLVQLERNISKLMEASWKTSASTYISPPSLDWSGWEIAVNDLHPRFSEIRKAMKAAGIPVTRIFGSTSAASGPPSKWLIALNRDLPFKLKRKLLQVLLPFDFEGIEFWEPKRYEGEEEDVYIGSYDFTAYAPVTAELNSLIELDLEDIDLLHYYDQNKVTSNKEPG